MHPDLKVSSTASTPRKNSLLPVVKTWMPTPDSDEERFTLLPSGDKKVLEEATEDAQEEDFSGFTGKQSEKGISGYFQQMQVSKKKRELFTEVSRKNRYLS